MEIFPATQPASCDHNGESQIEDEIRATIKKCLLRIRTWPVPRNWSFQDWRDEAEEVATVAAWQAFSDCKPPASSAFGCYVYQRILSSVRTRYRQEYLYGLRFAVSLVDYGADSDEQRPERATPYIEPAIEPVTTGDLTDALAKLSKDHREVIEQVFLNGRTEMKLAVSLRISRVAVNKRKHAALRILANLLREK